MPIIPELSGTAAGESGNPRHLSLLWEESSGSGHRAVKCKLCSQDTPPIKAWMGKGPFLKDELEAGAVYKDTHDINRLFQLCVAQTSLKIYSWQFPLNASFLSLQPHSTPAFSLPLLYFCSSIFLPSLIFPFTSPTSPGQEIMTPTWCFSLICVPPPIRTSAFLDAQALTLPHKKTLLVLKNQTDHS